MDREDETKALTPRRQALLLAVVQEFISTAAPVGSHQIVAHHSVGVRGAMVRSMMAELEEAGYLSHPHTSAGRVPTDKAYRLYVDRLIESSHIGFRDRAQIELHYSSHTRDLAQVMRDTPRLLALLTGQAALVMAPRLEAMVLERVNFIRLRDRQVLTVFVAAAGSMHQHLVETPSDHSQEVLDRMARYLNESLAGSTLDEARRWIEERLREERAAYDSFMHEALALGEIVAEHVRHAEVFVEGSAKALDQPEFANPERIRELLRALDDKTALLELLERALDRERLMVSIGSENYDPRLAGLSVVAAPYVTGSTPIGSLAIVGPVRMDYERVIPLVDYAARALSRLLEG
jgi:heat-inducible transcriptional repressor